MYTSPSYPRRVPGLALAGVSSARHQAPGTMLPQQPGPDASRRLRRVLVRLAPLAAAFWACWCSPMPWAGTATSHCKRWSRTTRRSTSSSPAHRIAAILSFVVIYAIGAILAMPAGAVLAVVGGFLFGALIGGAAAMIGSTLGATAVFLIARSAFGERLLRRLGPRVESFAAGFRADRVLLRHVSAAHAGAVLVHQSHRCAVRGAAADIRGRDRDRPHPRQLPARFVRSRARQHDRDQEVAYRACLAAGELDCRIEFRPGQRGDAHADRARSPVSACSHLRPFWQDGC